MAWLGDQGLLHHPLEAKENDWCSHERFLQVVGELRVGCQWLGQVASSADRRDSLMRHHSLQFFFSATAGCHGEGVVFVVSLLFFLRILYVEFVLGSFRMDLFHFFSS